MQAMCHDDQLLEYWTPAYAVRLRGLPPHAPAHHCNVAHVGVQLARRTGAGAARAPGNVRIEVKHRTTGMRALKLHQALQHHLCPKPAALNVPHRPTLAALAFLAQMAPVKPWTCKWWQIMQCELVVTNHSQAPQISCLWIGRNGNVQGWLQYAPAWRCHGAEAGTDIPRCAPTPRATGWTIALQLSFWMCLTLSWLWGTLERYFPALFGEAAAAP